MSIVNKLLHNKIIIYLLSRYGIYAIEFITSLFIADRLGPFYFGIYGFILLLLSYFGQLHLGIPNSLNVLIVHNKDNKQKCDNYIANSLFLYSYFAVAIAILYLLYTLFGFKAIEKYQVDAYLPAVCIIAILVYINGILTCVLRVKNKINQLSIVTSSKAVFNLGAVIFFSESNLIIALLVGLIVSNLITIIVCIRCGVMPLKKNISIKLKVQNEILRKGILLFFYNTCFYFIVISIQSIVSSNYSIEEYGAFAFSFTIASAVMVLLDSLMSLLFPKVVDLLSSPDYNRINNTLNVLRVSYVSTAHLLVYVAIIFFPVITKILLPQYSNATVSLNLISLAVLMNANSCGYSTLLIAKNKEKYSAAISISSLILNVILGLALVKIFNVDFSLVILATMVTYTYFSFLIVMFGKKIINHFSWRSTFKEFFPLKLFIPFILALLVSVFNCLYLVFVPLIVFLMLNFRDLKVIKQYAFLIINNENISDVQVK